MYKYFIFISYSRKDSKIAAYLQKQLENFRIPVKLDVKKENLPEEQDYLRPVFRDRRDLKNTEQSFTTDIQIALEQSRYLLVLCSQNSAESIWVNEEITYFLKTHHDDYAKIIPLILSGNPNSGDKDECLPSALRLEQITVRNLPSMKSDYGESETDDWEIGLAQVISYALKVDLNVVKKIIDRRTIRQMQKNICIIAVLAITFLFLAIWAIRAEHIAEKNLILARIQEQHARREEEIAKENEKRAIEAEITAKKNEVLAKEQMDIKNKAFAFLQDILKSANPSRNGLQKITLSDALKMKKQDVKNIENWQLRALLALEIGKLFDDHGEYEDAYELTSIAVALYTKNMPWTNEAGEACNIMGLIHLHQNKNEEALKFFNHAIIHYTRNNENSFIVSRIYRNIAVAYVNMRKLDDAMLYSKKSLDLCIKLKNELDIARAYNNLGLIYYKRENEGDNEKCLDCHKKALELKLNNLSNDNDIELASCYYSLALAYLRFNEYEQASQNAEKAYNIAITMYDESHPFCKQYKNILEKTLRH